MLVHAQGGASSLRDLPPPPRWEAVNVARLLCPARGGVQRWGEGELMGRVLRGGPAWIDTRISAIGAGVVARPEG